MGEVAFVEGFDGVLAPSPDGDADALLGEGEMASFKTRSVSIWSELASSGQVLVESTLPRSSELAICSSIYSSFDIVFENESAS